MVGATGLDGSEVPCILKRLAQRAGLEPSAISCHSARVGMAQDPGSRRRRSRRSCRPAWRSPTMPARYAERLLAGRGAVARLQERRGGYRPSCVGPCLTGRCSGSPTAVSVWRHNRLRHYSRMPAASIILARPAAWAFTWANVAAESRVRRVRVGDDDGVAPAHAPVSFGGIGRGRSRRGEDPPGHAARPPGSQAPRPRAMATTPVRAPPSPTTAGAARSVSKRSSGSGCSHVGATFRST